MQLRALSFVILALFTACGSSESPTEVTPLAVESPQPAVALPGQGLLTNPQSFSETFDSRTQGRLWVQVLREADGQPLEGVGVHLYWRRGDEETGRFNTMTHADGLARIPVPARTFGTHLDVDGTPFTAPVSLAINEIIPLGENERRIIHVKPAGILAGKVQDIDGNPVAGAEILIWADERWATEDLKELSPMSRGNSDGSGLFRVGGLPGGFFTVTAQTPEMVCVQRAGGLVEFGQTHEGIELLMTSAHEVFGEVYGADEQPLMDAVVIAGSPGRRADIRDTVNDRVFYYPAAQLIQEVEEDGSFLLKKVPDGEKWNLNLRQESHLSWYGHIEADQPVVRVDMEPGQTLRGVITDEQGAPVKQVKVRMVGKIRKKGKTRRNGDFAFVGVPEDPDAVLLFYKEGYAATGAWFLKPGVSLDIVLEEGKELHAQVFAPDGSPALGVRATVRRKFSKKDAAAFFVLPTPEEEFGLSETMTDTDGNLSLVDLASVPFLLTLESPLGRKELEVTPGESMISVTLEPLP